MIEEDFDRKDPPGRCGDVGLYAWSSDPARLTDEAQREDRR